jgi:TetR/AcrR family transcriptional repressor of nem operon
LVSVDEICSKAGVLKGSFYHFFPSKAALAVAAFEENWEQKQIDYDRIFSSQYSPQERFARYTRYLYDRQVNKKALFGRVCGCPYASLGSELSTQDEALRHVSERNAERTWRYFESALREAIAEGSLPPAKPEAIAEKAREIYAFVIGLLLQGKIQNSLEGLQNAQPTLLRLIGFKESVAA